MYIIVLARAFRHIHRMEMIDTQTSQPQSTKDSASPAEAYNIRPTDFSLPIMLLRARELVMEHIRPFLLEHDLTDAQWRVLRVLHQGGAMEPTEISAQGLVLTPSLTRILKALEARGFILREPHQRDGRRHQVQLTEKAVALVEQLAPLSQAGYREIETRFGAEDTRRLLALLSAFCER
ncbi:MAG: homoprotocatechuate degradation operon regulator HpaR [Pseudomonadota bacterium]